MPTAFLVASQRSGTHFFKSLLACHPRVRPTPEILLDRPGNLRSYWHWADRHKMAGLDGFLAFTRAVQARTPGKTVLFDIKYDQLRLKPETGPLPFREPGMVRLWKEHRFPVIHLVRENKLRIVISRQRARETRQYHVRGEAHVADKRVEMDCARLPGELEKLIRQEAKVRAWLAGAEVLTVRYEDLAENSLDETTRVLAFLNRRPTGKRLEPETKKIAPSDPAEAVKNWSDVERALTGTRFERYLRKKTQPSVETSG